MAYNDLLIDDVQEYLVLMGHTTQLEDANRGDGSKTSSSSATLLTADGRKQCEEIPC